MKAPVHRIVRHQFVFTRRPISLWSFPCWSLRWQGAEIKKVTTQAPRTASNFTQTRSPGEKKQAEEASNN